MKKLQLSRPTLKLVKDAIILVQRTQLGPQILVDSVGLNGLGLHVQVPDLDREIVPAMCRSNDINSVDSS